MMVQVATDSGDIYRPERSVSIDDRALSDDVMKDIVEVAFVDDIDDVDVVTLRVSNAWNPQTQSFPYSGSDLFAPGKRLDLAIGYRGSTGLVRMLRGTITSMAPVYPSQGAAVLIVRARSLQAELLRSEETRVYRDMSDSQIAGDICNRLNVRLMTDPRAEAMEPRYDYVIQLAQYDLVFLLERARRLGYEVMVDKSGDQFELYFGPSQNLHAGSLKLKYGIDLHEFHPVLDTADQVDQVEVEAWDPLNKKRLSATAGREDFPGLARLDSQIADAFRGRRELVCDIPVNDLATARAVAGGTMERIMKNMLRGHGSTVGTPELRAGRTLDISGLDTRFNGQYFVTGSRHSFGPDGYHTQFTCRREET